MAINNDEDIKGTYEKMLGNLNLAKPKMDIPKKSLQEERIKRAESWDPTFEYLIPNKDVAVPTTPGNVPYQQPIAGPVEAPMDPPTTQAIDPVMLQMQLQQDSFKRQQGALSQLAGTSNQLTNESVNAIGSLLVDPKKLEQNKIKMAQLEVEEDEQRKRIEATQKYAMKTIEEYNNLGVDSHRLWANTSTGNKILAGISVFLGGLGGGQNNALKMIDKAIDNDIREQETMINKKGTSANQARGLLADLTMQLGSTQAARSALEHIAATNVQNKLAQIAAKSNNAQVQSQAKMMSEQLQQAQQQKLIDIMNTAKIQQARAYLSPASDSRRQMLALLPQEDQDRYVEGPGYYGLINGTKEFQNKVKNNTIESMAALENLNQLQKMDKSYLPTEAKAVAQTLSSILKANLRTFLVGPGAVSETEYKILDEVIANPTDVWQWNNKARLKKLEEAISRKAQIEAKVAGLKVDENYDQVLSARPVEEKTGRILKGTK